MIVTDPSQIADYYNALIERNPGYVGIFYVAVKTTNVFCISTCRARKPKFENVLFYTSFKEALHGGYRPCKICKPTENANEAPEQVQQAIKLVQDNPGEKISDSRLREEEIPPELLRRWFKKHYGMTFQAYQRMCRINNAYVELKGGKKIIDAAFGTGYESVSGFGYAYKNLTGRSPKGSLDQNLILISRTTTPLGPMFICSTNKGICLLEFVDRRMLETEFRDIQRLLNARIITGENDHVRQAKKEIREYFEGGRTGFDMALDTPGTEFQNRVWDSLKDIAYGETICYQEQAEKMNNPGAVRAVASANGCNRLSIVIPCHRVIGKDGNLTGYGGGLERKKWLLNHEGARPRQDWDK